MSTPIPKRSGSSTSTGTYAPTTAALRCPSTTWPGCASRCPPRKTSGSVVLGHLSAAVVGAYVPVDVEDPDRFGMDVDMTGGEALDQRVRAARGGELGDAAAHRFDLRGAVQPQQPAQV